MSIRRRLLRRMPTGIVSRALKSLLSQSGFFFQVHPLFLVCRSTESGMSSSSTSMASSTVTAAPVAMRVQCSALRETVLPFSCFHLASCFSRTLTTAHTVWQHHRSLCYTSRYDTRWRCLHHCSVCKCHDSVFQCVEQKHYAGGYE